MCYEKTPYFMCVANKKCAYLKKHGQQSYIDILPFMSDKNRCVLREDYSEIVFESLESTVNVVNKAS